MIQRVFCYLWFGLIPLTYSRAQEGMTRYRDISLDSLLYLSSQQPDNPWLHAAIAEHYLQKNTVQSRQRAATAIRKAIELRPDHFPFRIQHIRILHAQGYYDAARREAKSLIQQSPVDSSHAADIAEAYYYSGYTNEREGFRYLNMKSNPSAGERALYDAVDLNLSEHAHRLFREAGMDYENAIRMNSNHRSAYFRLIMLYYEIKSYPMMLRLAEEARQRFPADPLPYLFSGLGHYATGQYRQAAEDYRQALNLMDERMSEGYFSIAHIVESHQQKDYQNAKSDYEKRVPWIERFWNAKDPLLSTPYNERQLEHYNRVTYANWRYSVPSQKLDGWKTERGQLYIRYGKPEYLYRIQPDERTLGGWEVWVYPNYTFYFRDDYASDHFFLDNRSMLALSSAYNNAADRYSTPYPMIPVSVKSYQFRSRSGETEIWFYTRYEASEAGRWREEKDSLRYSVFLLDSLYKIRSSAAQSVPSSDIGTKTVRAIALRVPEKPVLSKLRPYAAEIQWPGGKSISTARGQLALRDFTQDRLMLSDIVLSENPLSVSKEELIPKADSILHRLTMVYVYFEVYYLTLNRESKAQYNITARLSPSGGQTFMKAFSEWLKRNPKSDIATSFDATAGSRFDAYTFGMDLSNYPPGDYQLQITITDRNSGQTVSQALPVYIEE